MRTTGVWPTVPRMLSYLAIVESPPWAPSLTELQVGAQRRGHRCAQVSRRERDRLLAPGPRAQRRRDLHDVAAEEPDLVAEPLDQPQHPRRLEALRLRRARRVGEARIG